MHKMQMQQITKRIMKPKQNTKVVRQMSKRSATPTKEKRQIVIEPYREAMSQPNFVTKQLEPFRTGSAKRG